MLIACITLFLSQHREWLLPWFKYFVWLRRIVAMNGHIEQCFSMCMPAMAAIFCFLASCTSFPFIIYLPATWLVNNMPARMLLLCFSTMWHLKRSPWLLSAWVGSFVSCDWVHAIECMRLNAYLLHRTDWNAPIKGKQWNNASVISPSTWSTRKLCGSFSHVHEKSGKW